MLSDGIASPVVVGAFEPRTQVAAGLYLDEKGAAQPDRKRPPIPNGGVRDRLRRAIRAGQDSLFASRTTGGPMSREIIDAEGSGNSAPEAPRWGEPSDLPFGQDRPHGDRVLPRSASSGGYLRPARTLHCDSPKLPQTRWALGLAGTSTLSVWGRRAVDLPQGNGRRPPQCLSTWRI
jgi:hypothetical protein